MRVLFALVCLLYLAGCSSGQLTLVPQIIDREHLDLVPPGPLDLEDANWLVLTEDNALAQLQKLEDAGEPPVVIGVTPKGYESLTRNAEKLQGRIILLDVYLQQYRRYYETEKFQE